VITKQGEKNDETFYKISFTSPYFYCSFTGQHTPLTSSYDLRSSEYGARYYDPHATPLKSL